MCIRDSVFSPRALKAIAARNERPTSREISWVRPPIFPFTDSRCERSWVACGSIAYSAVTQPRPLPLRQRGTPWSALAAHRTRVLPNSMRQEPGAWSSQLRVMVIRRSSSVARPSSRAVIRQSLALANCQPSVGAERLDLECASDVDEFGRAVEGALRVGQNLGAVGPCRDVGQQQAADPTTVGVIACIGTGQVQVRRIVARSVS